MNVPELVSILRGYPSALADWESHDEEIYMGLFHGEMGPNGECWPESTRRSEDAVEYASQLRGAVAYHRDCLAKLARLTGKVLTLETGFPRTGGPPDEFQNALNDVLKNWTEANSEPTKPVDPQAATLADGDDAGSGRGEADAEQNEVPVLSELQYLILETMKGLGALSADTRQTGEAIATACNGKQAEVNVFKPLLSDLTKRDLTQSKTGSGGGSWLTPQGVDVANRLLKNRQASASKR